MKRTVWLWQLFGFGISTLLGTLLHFLYDFTKSPLAAAFSGVNESTWEHMKLLFWPMFIFAVVQSFFFKGYKNCWCVKLRGILLGMLLIPVIFYTYNGAVGKSPDFINIAIFFISAAIVYIYETKKLKNENAKCKSERLAFMTLCALGILFVIFTFAPLRLDLFKDPLTGSFGI